MKPKIHPDRLLLMGEYYIEEMLRNDPIRQKKRCKAFFWLYSSALIFVSVFIPTTIASGLWVGPVFIGFFLGIMAAVTGVQAFVSEKDSFTELNKRWHYHLKSCPSAEEFTTVYEELLQINEKHQLVSLIDWFNLRAELWARLQVLWKQLHAEAGLLAGDEAAKEVVEHYQEALSEFPTPEARRAAEDELEQALNHNGAP